MFPFIHPALYFLPCSTQLVYGCGRELFIMLFACAGDDESVVPKLPFAALERDFADVDQRSLRVLDDLQRLRLKIQL